MYIPEAFKEIRVEEIERIIKEYPFASVVANTVEGLTAVHVPLILKRNKYLVGHIAKNNNLPALLEKNQEVMCIFRGEDAYISANYYPKKAAKDKHVPTWNYQVIHVYGQIRFHEDQRSRLAAIGYLTKQIEEQTNGPDAWKMSDAPPDYIMQLVDQTIAFDVVITKILAKSKLGQIDTKSDSDAVIEQLECRGEVGMAECMRRLERED